MSEYSVDSLDKDSRDPEETGSHGEWNDLFFRRTAHRHTDNDAGYNESAKAEVTNRPGAPKKSHGNALIASTVNAVGKSCLTGGSEKLEVTPLLGATSNFRIGRCRPVAKKLDVLQARRSSLSSLTAAEFRLRVSPLVRRKSSSSSSNPSNDDIEGFMRARKKLGKPCRRRRRRTTLNKGKKKRVSYLELYYRRKFGAADEESSRWLTPEGSSRLSVHGERTKQQRLVYVDERASMTVSRDDESASLVGFYRRAMELGSQGPRESRSSEGLDRSKQEERVSKSSSCDVSECFSELVQPAAERKLRRRSSVYRPCSIEDYKSLSVPQADRSLGPDRIEMESKESRRADVQKPRLAPLTDVENPAPVSKVKNDNHQGGGSDSIGRAESLSKIVPKKENSRVSRIGKLAKSVVVVVKRDKPALSKPEPKVPSSFLDSYETSSDTTKDSRNHGNLRLRHLTEKRKIDRLLKRGLCA